MHNLLNKLGKIQDEIKELEERELTWENVERLAMLYTVEHHMCKKVGTMIENGALSDSDVNEIGFKSIGKSNANTREIREMANGMNKQQLTDVIISSAREMNQNGNNREYNSLYNKMRGYNNER